MALTLLLPLLLPSSSAKASNVDDSLVVGIQSNKTTVIRPLEPQERDMMSIYDLVYETLIVIDDNYLPSPGVAESWEMSSNGRTWTFKLRTSTFSNGTPLTANDVVATAQAILARANNENGDKGYYANLSYFVDRITAKDDATVEVRAKSERAYWGLLYAMTFPILPAGWANSDNPPGSGAYMIDMFNPMESLSLVPNPHWWQNAPQVKRIMVQMNNTQQAVIEDYEYARVQTIFTRAVAAAQYKSGTTSLALDYRTNQLETLLMNQSSWKLSSLGVRRAIRFAIDVDRIANNVYMGMVLRTDTPMISGTWMYNDTLSSYFRTDLEEARRLLEEEGWNDIDDDGYLEKARDGKTEKLTLRLDYYEEPDNSVRVEVANFIADALAQIGIQVTISARALSDVSQRLSAGNFDLALVSYAMDTCPDPGFLLMKGNTGNYGRYRSDRMDTLCKELRKATSQQEFQQKLLEIQSQFAEDCPFICLFYRAGAVLTRRMYTTVRDVRELHLLKGIESFRTY
ncbi:MAG: hypothetical protein J1E43_03230 [Christensenellaceae bacterium]|nr:hypothetical protein [Christensenellaceae bacterium]